MAILRPDVQRFTSIGSTTAAFSLLGGLYGIDYVGTLGGGVVLQRLGADGSTWIGAAATVTAQSYVAPTYLTDGEYRLSLSTTTSALSVNIARIRAGD